MSGHIQSLELRACSPYLLVDDETTGWTGKKRVIQEDMEKWTIVDSLRVKQTNKQRKKPNQAIQN